MNHKLRLRSFKTCDDIICKLFGDVGGIENEYIHCILGSVWHLKTLINLISLLPSVCKAKRFKGMNLQDFDI